MTTNSSGCPHGWEPTQLMAYVEGALSQEEEREVETHLQECTWCRKEAESLADAHNLLLNNPLVFHPDSEELVRFVAQGEDPESETASHVKSCRQCAHDVEFVRKMQEEGFKLPESIPRMPRSLMKRLEAEHGIASHEPRPESLVSKILHLMESRFRIPMLAVGTAAAVVVIVALFLPRTAVFHEVPRAPGLSPPQEPAVVTAEKKSVPSAVPAKHKDEKPAAVDSDKEGGRPLAPHALEKGRPESAKLGAVVPLEREAKEVAPASEAEAPAAPQRRAPAAKPTAPVDANRSRPVHPKMKAERAVYPKAQYHEFTRTDREAFGDKRSEADRGTLGLHSDERQEAPAPGSRSESFAYAEIGHEPIEVRIIDSTGKDIQWWEYLRGQLSSRRPTAAGEAPSRESTAPDHGDKRKQALKETNDRAVEESVRPRLLLLITIEKRGDEYGLEAKLLERATNSTLRTIREDKVSKEELRKRVAALVRRFTPGQ